MKNFLFNKRQKGSLIILSFLSLGILAYGYHCGVQKVCGLGFVERVVREEKKLILPQGEVYAEVANTSASRERGLSGRSSLDEDKGMLFVFDASGKYGFWMKDMKFSIDMVWINQDGIVVHVEREIAPETYFNFNPPKTFVNTPEAKYVLELASGAAEKHGIYLGTKVEIGE